LPLVVLMFALGVLSKTLLAQAQLRLDRYVAEHDRTPVLTSLARAATTIATPEIVGLAALVLIPLALLIGRRRVAALRSLCVLGGALALALVTKSLIGEPRPPTALWALQADHSPSYPSGHATVAAAIAVALVLAATTTAWRATATVLAGAYALAVAASRVYLADHYPLDVLGSIGCAVAAGFVVAGLAALPALRRRLNRIDPAPSTAPAAETTAPVAR
jgi:undecaprenyl-diphosphatase